MSRFSCLVTFLLGMSAAVPAIAYDASWYKANGWSGEYPYGFTMAKDVTVTIRESLDPNAPKTISCQLKKGANYHQWNRKRIQSDQLDFISFTKIQTYETKFSLPIQLEQAAQPPQEAAGHGWRRRAECPSLADRR